ncbi:uncharacterized protein I303_108715 [Kwoniella dejecticola CBS 10117]|uniref:Importin N-terminal domain-containing protein n=1 Tax=Kwoniella dejecticola CBS 10117 TaxID=1296121 RepID=A0A1A5ZWL8_9TREE|nr:uncharacterized protein I303_06960 [Kwoniella dejecticola CBS 10117]OBR82201.1 hypothetical protein I303_06960 [Kwoniella dejecticola CBS 10117]
MEAQVLSCLQATLNPDESLRKQAEEQLKQLFLIPEGGLSLAKILLAQDVDLHQRQMRVLLQQYVNQHWTPASASFQHPITPIEIKAQIRPLIFSGLSDSQRKIRLSAAFALSTIARYDWPDDYPDLLSQLVGLLGGSPNSVHGAMRVISDFVRNDLSEDQLLPVVEDLLPAVLGILGDPERHSAPTRAQTISVVRQTLRMLETVKDEHPASVKSAMESLSPVWLNAFTHLLSLDASEEVRKNWEDLSIRIEIFRTFSLYHNAFPKYLHPHLPTYIPLAIRNLQSLLSQFQAFYLSNGDDAPEPPSPVSDVGMLDPRVDITDLACAIFDFLTPAVRTKNASTILLDESGAGSNTTRGIVDIVLDYTQITRENEEEWMEDPNAFVIDEDDETEQYGIRSSGYDLIGSMMDKWARPLNSILQTKVEQKVQESADLKSSGNIDWWKPLESVLSLIGGVSDDLREIIAEEEAGGGSPTFDLQYLFDQVIPGLLQQSETPFLQGRAFVFASQFASHLSHSLAAQYLGAAVHVLDSREVSVPVKISAVKTIKNFCRHIPAEIIQPQSRQILSLLLPLLPEISNETLYLVLETIRAVFALDTDLINEETIGEIASRIYDVWVKYTDDPVTTAIIEETIESLASLPNPAVAPALVRLIAPRLSEAISTPVDDDTVHVPGEAVQLANSLIRTRPGPLEAELIGTVTAAIMGILRITDDMDVIQHGMIHLTLVVRKDCDKLIQWHDQEGNNGIHSIFHLLSRFLAPTFSESGGIFVGELIMHLFRKAGSVMAPVLPDLLKAIVNRLIAAQLPSFIQTLVLPFAYLFGTEYTTSTIDLLSSFSVRMNEVEKSGLQVVLEAWCEHSDTISGSWNIRVSALGLSKLFMVDDARLKGVIVRGDLIVDERNRDTIMTRSRTRNNPNQFTQVPFPLKAFKLILKDVQSEPTQKGKGKSADYNIDEDDGDEEWDDDDPLGGGDEVGEFDYLSSWLDTKDGNENDAQDDDEDLKSDPLAQIDMGQHLTDLLRQSYANNNNDVHAMISELSEVEKKTLREVLTL